MSSTLKFENKTVVITGATSGLGVDIASAFVKEGARVVIGGRRAETGAAVAKRIGATYIRVDVADEQSNKDFFAAAAKELGGSFDYVLLNAGIEGDAAKSTIDAFDVANFDATFNINVRGLLIGQREAIANVRAGGKIVYTSSGLSVFPFSGTPIYSASKAAVDALARCYARAVAESADERVKTIEIFSMNPVLFESEMSKRFVGGDAANLAGLAPIFNPSRVVGQGSDLAQTLFTILLPGSPYRSGDNVVIDAGTGDKAHWHVRETEAKYAELDAANAKAAAAAAAAASQE